MAEKVFSDFSGGMNTLAAVDSTTHGNACWRPQPKSEHEEPEAAQVTPLLEESFCSVAVRGSDCQTTSPARLGEWIRRRHFPFPKSFRSRNYNKTAELRGTQLRAELLTTETHVQAIQKAQPRLSKTRLASGWRCQGCGSSENLQVHHLEARSKLGGDTMKNLITLYADRHRKAHRRAHATIRNELAKRFDARHHGPLSAEADLPLLPPASTTGSSSTPMATHSSNRQHTMWRRLHHDSRFQGALACSAEENRLCSFEWERKQKSSAT